jgi:hypothetical protein
MEDNPFRFLLNKKTSVLMYDGSFQRNKDYTKSFIVNQQNYFNDLLKVRGNVFLNEILDVFGLKRTRVGAMYGWLKGPINISMEYSEEEKGFYLTFNCEGTVFDKI